jgi:hypothetical protein
MTRPVWLVAHAAATWYMTGVIWMVQLVHYPLFARVGEATFTEYQRAHVAGMTPVVLPAMLIELVCAATFAFRPHLIHQPISARVGFALVLALWASTFLVQVPLHDRLLLGFDAQAHGWLVATNWLRTALWTLRGLLAGDMLLRALRSDQDAVAHGANSRSGCA